MSRNTLQLKTDILVIIVDTKSSKIMAVPTAGSWSCDRRTARSWETVPSYNAIVRTFLWNSFMFTETPPLFTN
jgi:hypothetical protein